MGRYCNVCHRQRPNEKFGGRGQRARICNHCRKLPKLELHRILAIDEMCGFLSQSNISLKNQKRLQELAKSEDNQVGEMALLIFSIAQIRPFKKKRWPTIRQVAKHLYDQAIELGVLDEDCFDEHPEGRFDCQDSEDIDDDCDEDFGLVLDESEVDMSVEENLIAINKELSSLSSDT
jgi:hypothetical protein